MPELPEVETVARGLDKLLPERGIDLVKILTQSSIAYPNVADFQDKILGKSFRKVWRRAKYICYELSGDLILVQHLKMSGQMILTANNFQRSPFLRAYFSLDNKQELRFNDQRRFGRLWLFTKKEAEKFFTEKKLGPEPLSENWTVDILRKALRTRTRSIKPLLMDQTFISGLGNIYVDESLFASKIYPLRASNSISHIESESLFNNIRKILLDAIQERGTSVSSYRDSMGRPGRYLNLLKVYNKKGQPCAYCGNSIKYMRVGQRGTHYCDVCQR